MKRLVAILAGLLVAAAAFCQNSIKVSVQNLVAVDEQFSVTFTIEGEHRPSDFSWDPGSDFQLVWGPQKGSSTSISIVNGKKTQTSQTTYTYVLLPRSTGTFHLPAATATIKGDTVSSKSATVQVVSNGAATQQSQGGGSQSSGGSSSNQGSTSENKGDDLFMRLSVSKTRAVVGETINATLKLYHRVNIAGFEDAKFPTFNGFWSQEQQAPTNIEFHRENVGDRIYNAAVLRSWTLIPQQAGEITIDPAELVCLVNVRAKRSSTGSIFDDFFQDDYQTVRRRITTPAIKVSVSRIPEGAPASFGGGVGSFRMSAALNRDSLQTHDAGTLRITISGKGNLSLLEAPKVSFPPDFECYDVKTSESGGSRTFEYPFIPRSHGDFTIGPIEYSYYDPSTGKFVTLSAPQMPIKVSKGTDSAPAVSGGQLEQSVNRKDVRDLGSDIRHIALGAPGLVPKDSFFVGSGLFWLIVTLLCLAAAAIYLGFRKVAARRADVAGTRRSAASKMARKRLAKAGEFLNKDLYSAFYEELHKALLGFVGDKLSMPAADLNKETISERLVSEGVSEELAGRFSDLLDACEFARYAPSEGHEAMNAHYEGAVSVISEIDSSMRKSHKAGAVIALLVLFALPMHAQSADSLWTRGIDAYSSGRWSEASAAWQALADSGQQSSTLYYNLGNAAFKQDDLAHAIIWYERALKVDPSNKDARFNLEFARSRVQDRIEEVPEFFLEEWGRAACWSMPGTAWAVLFIVLFAAFLAMLLLFLLGNGGRKKLGFFAGIVLLLCALVCLDFAFWQRTDALRHDEAVVVQAVTEVKSSPGSGVSLFVLHEGTKVKVLEEISGWNNIELSDGRQGWLQNDSVERI